MKLIDIIVESFSTAADTFKRQGASEEEVSKYIQRFRDLNSRHMLSGVEKDITAWIRQGWEAFRAFVDGKQGVSSGKQRKRDAKKDSITIYENDKVLLVIPLSKTASCFYGRGTKWCTAATEQRNMFNQYFKENGTTLVYAIEKGSGQKYALAVPSDKSGVIEAYDAEDKAISPGEVARLVGLSLDEILELVQKYDNTINDQRSGGMTIEDYLDDGDYTRAIDLIIRSGKRHEGFERLAAQGKIHLALMSEYVQHVIKGPWDVFETKLIEELKNPRRGELHRAIQEAIDYTRMSGKRIPELEELLYNKGDTMGFFRYASMVAETTRKPVPEFVKLALEYAEYDMLAYYGKKLGKKNWPELEKILYATVGRNGYITSSVMDGFEAYSRAYGEFVTEEGQRLKALMNEHLKHKRDE